MSSPETRSNTPGARPDPNTQSNYLHWRVEHTTTNFRLNFDQKRLEGNVSLRLRRQQADGGDKVVVLDANYLDIREVKVDGRVVADYEVTEPKRPAGGTLSVPLTGEEVARENVELTVALQTTDKCTALQWLTPEQTSGRKHPYVFSQCQPNHARSIFPCQDTPAVKSTFSNTFASSLPVLNSGLDAKSSGNDGVYRFQQDVPIPSYLYSLASGDIARAPIGKHSEVATGPDELAAAKWEFEADMDNMITTISNILPDIPYAWGTYNVLVLPPSFPYGGMENPVWTFATPTVISGDRQNVDVIAHELSHSWSGNLVSPTSWESSWLNEGWTTYLERRIQAVLHGEPHFHFSAIIGWKALTDSIQHFGEKHPFTALCPDLAGQDPDDAFSSVQYEKGFVFLYHLDLAVGRVKWDKFANHYFKKYARQSLSSGQFKTEIFAFFAPDAEATAALTGVDWDSWYFAPGFPPKPNFDTSLADVCYALADKWASRISSSASFEPSKSDIASWSANQVVVFLERIQLFTTPLSAADAQLLGTVYGLATSKNVEIVSRYLRIALASGDRSAIEPTTKLLGEVGRMKFVRPLFRALEKVDRDTAVETFRKNEAFYHPVCRAMVEADLFPKKG